MAKFNELTMAEKAIVVGGILLFIPIAFLPWYHLGIPSVSFEGVRVGGGSVNTNGFDAPGDIWSMLAILVSLAMAASVLAEKMLGVKLPELGSFSWSQAYGAGAIAVAVLMLLKAWRIMAVPAGGFGWGFFLAIVAAAAVVYGGFMKFQEGGGSFSRRA